jgi:hypothetical protein
LSAANAVLHRDDGFVLQAHYLARRMAYSMIPKKPAPDSIRGGYRFPACAKPCQRLVSSFDASAGEGRSEKIVLK